MLSRFSRTLNDHFDQNALRFVRCVRSHAVQYCSWFPYYFPLRKRDASPPPRYKQRPTVLYDRVQRSLLGRIRLDDFPSVPSTFRFRSYSGSINRKKKRLARLPRPDVRAARGVFGNKTKKKKSHYGNDGNTLFRGEIYRPIFRGVRITVFTAMELNYFVLRRLADGYTLNARMCVFYNTGNDNNAHTASLKLGLRDILFDRLFVLID